MGRAVLPRRPNNEWRSSNSALPLKRFVVYKFFATSFQLITFQMAFK